MTKEQKAKKVRTTAPVAKNTDLSTTKTRAGTGTGTARTTPAAQGRIRQHCGEGGRRGKGGRRCRRSRRRRGRGRARGRAPRCGSRSPPPSLDLDHQDGAAEVALISGGTRRRSDCSLASPSDQALPGAAELAS